MGLWPFWRVSAWGRSLGVVITVGEAASRVGRSPETVRRWIRSGRLPASRDRGRLLLDASDVDTVRDELYPMLPLPEEWRRLEDGTPAPNGCGRAIGLWDPSSPMTSGSAKPSACRPRARRFLDQPTSTPALEPTWESSGIFSVPNAAATRSASGDRMCV